MGLINISETQLAFGYLHSFLNVNRPVRFMLPSLRQEGGLVPFKYAGADIIISDNHLIQFKRPFYFTTNGIKEYRHYDKPADIDPPYFRINIKNDNPTNQLNRLIDATTMGFKAEYISPIFHLDNDFFRLLRNDNAHLQAYAHIDIAQFNGMQAIIGNNNDHTILYTRDSIARDFCYCFSEPKQIKGTLINSNVRNEKQTENYTAREILRLIDTIFFNENQIYNPDKALLSQCVSLQRKLLIERNIIWTFKYNINE